MEDDRKCVLRPRTPKRGCKRQIIQTSPGAGDQVAEVDTISNPNVLKTLESNKTTRPLQPAFQLPGSQDQDKNKHIDGALLKGFLQLETIVSAISNIGKKFGLLGRS